MRKITSASDLKNAIQLLEIEQEIKGQRLKEQFYFTCKSFKLINLIKSSLSDIVSSPHLIDSILSAAIGIATGYLSKKIFIGASGNLFRKLIGSVLQLGVTSFVARHPMATTTFGKSIFHRIFNQKEIKFIKP